jgi:hypothetical protein
MRVVASTTRAWFGNQGMRFGLGIVPALLAATCAAHEPGISLPLYVGGHAPATLAGADPAAQAGAEAQSTQAGAEAQPSQRDAGRASPTGATDPRFSLIEIPPEFAPAGRHRRPHHALGYRWHGAESWLRDRGIDAQTCYLPMVRLHSRIRPGEAASGTLWIYGRCSFR